MLGAASVALGQTLAVGSIAPISQPALAQVPRPALAPSHAIQPSLLSQRLVLTSQAQARLPSKWPPLPSPPPLAQQYGLLYTELRPSLGGLLICVHSSREMALHIDSNNFGPGRDAKQLNNL